MKNILEKNTSFWFEAMANNSCLHPLILFRFVKIFGLTTSRFKRQTSTQFQSLERKANCLEGMLACQITCLTSWS